MPYSIHSNSTCPICGQLIQASAPSIYIPFCSTRCQTIDLGNWLSDTYRIPVNSADENEEDTIDNTNLIDNLQNATNYDLDS